MSDDAVQLVQEFMAALGETLEANLAAYERYLAEDVVFDTGSRVLRSREAVLAHVRHIPVEYGVEATRMRITHIAGTGDVVLTERVDDLIAPDGRLLIGSRVMGTLEVKDGRIVAWRDYYDTRATGQELEDAKAQASPDPSAA